MNSVSRQSSPKKFQRHRQWSERISFALLLGFLINAGGNLYTWYRTGYEITIRRIDQQSKEQLANLSASSTTVATYYKKIKVKMTAGFNALLINANRLWRQTVWTKKIKANPNEKHLMQDVVSIVWRFLTIFFSTALLLFIELTRLAASFWLYLFAGLIGAMDGLVARYIRTAEGGRESTFVFHKVSDSLLKIPALILFIYLIAPIALNPTVVVMALSMALFLFFRLMTSNLKKFL